MLNIVYDKGDYYIHEPGGDRPVSRDPDVIIDKHCWLVTRFMLRMRTPISLGDILRFGRVTFKVTELVIT